MLNTDFLPFVRSLFLGAFLVLTLHGCSQPAPTERPNVILIMADDLGWGDVGFNGNQTVQTPSLDQLAESGIVLERFYSASAVCSPTRASVLTGRNPIRVGVPTANAGHLHQEELTLAELLRDAGYATGHFGKWHLGTLTTQIRDSNRGRPGDTTHFSIPTQHGFDEYFSTEAKVPTYDPMLKPVAFDTLNGENPRYGWAALHADQPNESYGTHYFSDPAAPATNNLSGPNSKVIMDRVLPFISRSKAKSQPFFTVIWFHTPHLPVVADSSYRSMYPGLSHAEQIYYGSISAMDTQVGRLVTHLRELEELDNTMIWFASDNGPERDTPGSAGPYRERKRSLYEGGVRVPAFVTWQHGIRENTSLSVPAVTSDYLPTLVEYLGLTYPQDRVLDGISLAPILAGDQDQRGTPIGFYFQDKQSWVDDTYKLITRDRGRTFELYNLIEDPSEEEDLSQQLPNRAQAMQLALEEWVEAIQ